MNARFLGLSSLSAALEWQDQCVANARSTSEILGFELEPVITLGKRGDLRRDLLFKSEIPVMHVSRGGEATLHEPGQLVIFPVVDLRRQKFSVREFVWSLSQITQSTLKNLGVQTHTAEEPGLYTQVGKIAFFGLRICRGVSSHGLSINVSNDLRAFEQIRSCGVSHAKMDSLMQQGVRVDLKNLFSAWIDEAAHVWKLDAIKRTH